ncbi:MAG TPA: hypothetical protein VG897_14885 [Terriglobales bacterium]|nr:hypothetical protein [Terriglobales bacterium]
MKKLTIVLALAITASAVAQTKPSAAVSASATGHSRPTQTLIQPEAAPDATALPIGTAIRMKLETPLSTSTNKFGDHFGGRVVEAVTLNGKTIIPVGAALEGQVIRAEEHRRIKGTPELDLRPTMITLPDGQKYAINASITDTSDRALNVNDEGQIKGKGRDAADWVETGVGAALGTGIGAAVGGGKGALIGATIGAGATMVHWLTKTKSAQIPAGTEIIMELSRPMALNAMQEGD